MADVIDQAGKTLGQLEQLAAKESIKFEKGANKVKRAFLLVAAKDLVWALINSRIEDMTQVDIEEAADDLGLSLEEFANANPKKLAQIMAGDAIEEALERTGDDGVADSVAITDDDLAKAISQVKI
jgi:hypothetical protein